MKMMGMEMHHVGEKPTKETGANVAEPTPPKEYFPSLHLSSDQVPDVLKGMEHDDEVILVAKARVSNIGTSDDGKGKRYNVELEFQEMGVKPFIKKKASEMDEDELIEDMKAEKGYDREEEG